MTLDIHRPYQGVALVVTDNGSVLLGAPADAFKATKKYCQDHDLPFPRELVAPQALLVAAAPQFNPEFFLYDFLFVYGAAFKPDLAGERLKLVVDADQVRDAKEALRITLNGPTRQEMASYRNPDGTPAVDPEVVDKLASISEEMAIKKGDRPREIDDSIETIEFGADGTVDVLDGTVRIKRTGPDSFEVKSGRKMAQVALTIEPPVIPFATLPVPKKFQPPLTFGVKPLGTRSGFDLSGPTTGFLLWVNGRAVIYDGPVGTRYLLESQGISPEDVEAVILSHCHEDHMGAFVELFLAGYRPKVLTAEPIYRSALLKLSGYFRRPEHEVAKLLHYRRVVPGQPIDELGARWEFFYTVHSIPTIGLRVSMKGRRGITHSIQISGDTMHHEGLDQMREKGVITEDHHAFMKQLVPDRQVKHAAYFADVGEAIIHGHPKDWSGNPNHIIYYHCPDNDHTRSHGKEVASPGMLRTLIEPRKLHPSAPGRLLSALRFLELNDPGWFQTILFQGRSRTAEPGEVLAIPGEGDRDTDLFTVIVSGAATVTDADGKEITKLRPGEFFGVIELVDREGRKTATVTAETPMELFEVAAHVFHDYVERNGLQDVLEQIWTKRPLVESAKIFRRLDTAVRNQIARAATEQSFEKGDVIVEEGSKGDDFFLLIEGEVTIKSNGSEIAILAANDRDAFFGEMSAINPDRARGANVVAKTDVRVLRIDGGELRHLFENHMGVRYALMVAIEKRGR